MVIYANLDGSVECECQRCVTERYERGEYKRREGESVEEYIKRLPTPKVILCAECENKRCPKTADHALECAGKEGY